MHLLNLWTQLGQDTKIVWLALGGVSSVVTLQLKINDTADKIDIQVLEKQKIVFTLNPFQFCPSARELHEDDCGPRL